MLCNLHEILLYGSQLVDGRVVILDTAKAVKHNQPDSKPKDAGSDSWYYSFAFPNLLDETFGH